MTTTTEASIRADQALAVVVEARIQELLRYRRWYRHQKWAKWPDLRREHNLELRALVRLARTARKLTAL